MKVELERKIAACPAQIRCTVCQTAFPTQNIRALLYSDRGLLQGDICPSCLKLKAPELRKKLKDQAQQLVQQARLDTQSATLQRGLELLDTAQEALVLPKFYDWWLKQLEVLSQERQELEAARLGLNCPCGKPYGRRSHLRIVFEDDQ